LPASAFGLQGLRCGNNCHGESRVAGVYWRLVTKASCVIFQMELVDASYQ
jgi:hypothetical protein